MFELKNLVAKGKGVRFICLMANSLWYETDDGFTFPIPLTETEGATFLAEDKALLFMRHIRKHLPLANGLEGGLAKTHCPAPEGEQIQFSRFKDMELWFRDGTGFEFPVPLSEFGPGAIYAVENASKFRMFSEKHHTLLAEARVAA